MADNGTTPSPAPLPAPSSQPASTSDIVHATNLSTCVLVILVMSWSLGGHHLASRSRHLTEGSAACLLGLITGLVLLVFHHYLSWEIVTQLLEFNAAGFFTYLLPPVIFYCGLSVEHGRFFMALPSILMYGVFGTLTSFAIISIFMYVALGFALFKLEDCLAMGAIFAATDSVATLQVLDRSAMPGLFSLVFGEGVVNDAVSVVLLGAVAATARAREAVAAGEAAGHGHAFAGGVVFNFVYLLITSLLLGAAAGLGTAMCLKSLRLTDAHQELAVITLLSYLSYLLADVAGLSGILSLFVCGVVVSHYALHNVSEEGRSATMTGFRTASYLAEGIIFIYVGMDALDPLKWKGANAAEALWLVVVLTALLAAARAAFVVPFSLLHNCWSADKLSSRDIVVVWWAGLMRGAVSVALVYYYFDDNPRQMLDKGRATLIVSTLMVVMLSILGFGALTKPLLAAMLKNNDAPLMDQLRTIPLLSNLGRDASSASLLIEQLDNSFRSSRNNHHHQQQQQHAAESMSLLGNDRENNSHTGDSGYGNNSNNNRSSRRGSGGGSGGLGGLGGGGMWGYSSSSSRGGATTSVGRGGSIFSMPGRRGPNSSHTGGHGAAAAATRAAPVAPAPAGGPAFVGFTVDDVEEPRTESSRVGGPLIAVDEFSMAPQGSNAARHDEGLSFSTFLTPQQQQQQQGPAAVEMQQGGLRAAAAAGGGGAAAADGSSMLGAMLQMGEAWGVFDRQVMQPMFGGPSSKPENGGDGGHGDPAAGGDGSSLL